ncbi:hypothetical protein RV11_GL003150 [Enterococcus phoeniculicola]|uniref:Protein kinase domain-containing protein n=1 Tax=Enterococcus phoeniculicola ATCC BAA-412 TaxID=1158610 RepID=R3W631_9ENTE|nr:class III lanthionine synthetase LanKC [Enterococcus phoeniculicola]EOL43032.1 hypothetical protein UC3_02009 [Enterococcus phoeniculicola ATCC BAA-412]EOT76610.1 hypothetical protein I589_01567 [Enterococcus phoeniculicola ATCC BAA-412]OJG72179.1 hypothetical protein RV11_GL003150 [Enterococcus phoeniculicola]
MNVNDYSLDNPLFFTSKNEMYDFSKRFSLPLPDGWYESENEEWINLYPLTSMIQRQGWKVHVSAEYKTANEILDIVSTLCFSQNVVFKHLSTMKVFRNRNGKLMDRGFSGKFITCYPDEDKLEEFLNLMEKHLDGFNGPYILSDRRWKKAPIYLRYGVFRETVLGELEAGIGELTIAGKQVTDERLPKFIVPEGIEIPRFIKEWINSSDDVVQENMPFTIKAAIRYSNSGGIYKAILKKSGFKTILKEARPYTGIDNEGTYSSERLVTEKKALERLQTVKGIPECLWQGKVWEHTYIAVEHIEGIPLNRWVTNNFPIYENQEKNYLKRALRVIKQLVLLVNNVHNLGVYHQDIHLGNIIIDEQDNIHLIDWEQSVFTNSTEVYHQIAAQGFRAWGENKPEQIDWYGVSQTAHYLFMPLIVQSDLVYGYGQQTREAGIILFKHLEYSYEDIKKYLSELDFIYQKTKQVKVISKNKLLRPFLVDKELSKDISLISLGKQLIAGVIPVVKNWRNLNRSFPVHYYGLSENEGVAYSDLGIIWAYSKLLNAIGEEETSAFNHSKRKAMQEAILFIKFGKSKKNGLFDGKAGTLWLLSELGMEEESAEVFNQEFETMMDHTTSNKLYDGISGILLVGLYFLSRNLVSDKLKQNLILNLEKFAKSYKANPSAHIPIGAGKKESNDPYDQESGLLYGHAGLGWFFAEAAKLTKNKLYRDCLELAIESELVGYVPDKINSIQYSQGGRLLPYFSMGSAGLGVLLANNSDIIPKKYLNRLNNIYNALNANFCIFPGLFTGYSGLKFGEFIINKELKIFSKDDILKSYANGLRKYLIRFGNGVCLAGDSGERITMDIASGFGGTALGISSILDDVIYILPQIQVERR